MERLVILDVEEPVEVSADTTGLQIEEAGLCLKNLRTGLDKEVRDGDGTCNAPPGQRPPSSGSDCDPTCKFGNPS